MREILKKPDTVVSHRPGLLIKDHFQASYVTNDMAQAKQLFHSRYGIKDFTMLGGPTPTGGTIQVAFAWVGPTLYEIICAQGPGMEFYNELLPGHEHEFAVRFHHHGFLIHDRDARQALADELAESGSQIVYQSLDTGFIDAYYIKAPELGHYLEYVYPSQRGLDFLNAIPVN